MVILAHVSDVVSWPSCSIKTLIGYKYSITCSFIVNGKWNLFQKKKSVRSKFLNLKIVRILFLTDLRLLAMHQFLTGNLDLITIWRIRQNPSSGVTIFSEMGMASSPVDHSETCALSSMVQSLETMVQVCSKLLCYLYIFL